MTKFKKPFSPNYLKMKIVICFLLALAGVSSVDVKSLLDTTYTDGSGNNVTLSDLSGKYIGLYFSASWCGGCRKFTPIMADIYNKIHVDKKWEVIWVTHDKNETDADEYFKEMPWIRLPWSEVATRGASMFKLTKQHFIPSVTMIDLSFNVINPEASLDIEFEQDDFPWAKRCYV